ncbi:MAG: saccharopine dehydrogenase NADP-binding domain-containing protein [Pseudomonadota bacterium]
MVKNAEFDVVIYGASGFTGRLVAEYLVQNYKHSNIAWALAGRDEAKLVKIRDEIGASEDTPLVVADCKDGTALAAMAKTAKCIISTVGPYTLYGEKLVEVCAREGTDYVDLCGEVLFMHEMITKHEETAKKSGARIVFSCGFDSIPFDLGVQFLEEEAVRRFGVPCPRVRTRVSALKLFPSGGSISSVKVVMDQVKKYPSLLTPLMDPFSLTGGFVGLEQPPANKVIKDETLDVWVAPFMLAIVNAKNIHRSNALLGHAYGQNFVYDEMIIGGEGDAGKAAADAYAATGVVEFGGDPPKPGEGPSKEERDKGFFEILVHGTASTGETLSITVKDDVDPGYGSTSKMLAESALCLLEERADTPGGIYTTAPAMGADLRKRLIERAGFKFEVES